MTIHDWLPMIAGTGIGVALAAYLSLRPLGSALLSAGLTALFIMIKG